MLQAPLPPAELPLAPDIPAEPPDPPAVPVPPLLVPGEPKPEPPMPAPTCLLPMSEPVALVVADALGAPDAVAPQAVARPAAPGRTIMELPPGVNCRRADRSPFVALAASRLPLRSVHARAAGGARFPRTPPNFSLNGVAVAARQARSALGYSAAKCLKKT